MQPFASEKKRFLWNHISACIAWSLTSILRFSTSLAQINLESTVCKFGSDPAIRLQEAIFVKSQKCPYHVTFDLNLEHTLYAGRAGDHRVQVWWRSSHFACEKKRFLWNHKSVPITWPLTSTLTLSTLLMQVRLGTIVCNFGHDPAICAKCLQTDRWTDRWMDAARLH